MIHGIYYQPIYLILVTVFSIVYYNKYASSKNIVYDNKRFALFLAILFSIFIGFRPPFDVLSDTGGLVMYYQYGLLLLLRSTLLVDMSLVENYSQEVQTLLSLFF